MILKTQPVASRLKRGLWVIGALILLDVSIAAANRQFNIEIVAATAKKLAAGPFISPQSVPDYPKQISYADFGKERPRPGGNWRPEVHDSGGLSIASDTGEWIWRPLLNPAKLQLSYFEVDNPRDFGLCRTKTMAALYRDLCRIKLATESPLALAIRSLLHALKRLQQSGAHDHAPDGARGLSNGEAHWQAI